MDWRDLIEARGEQIKHALRRAYRHSVGLLETHVVRVYLRADGDVWFTTVPQTCSAGSPYGAGKVVLLAEFPPERLGSEEMDERLLMAAFHRSEGAAVFEAVWRLEERFEFVFNIDCMDLCPVRL